MDTFIGEGERYLRALERIKGQAAIPVIGSLNANSVGGWVRFARLMAEAGADAIELNLYRISVDRTRTSVDIEEEDLELIAAVRAAVNLPLAVKLSPYYSALANFAGKAVEAGANGLVLFNRFYQPDIDLEELAVVPKVSLSHPSELRLPMRWTAILRPQLGPEVGIAATSGVHPAARTPSRPSWSGRTWWPWPLRCCGTVPARSPTWSRRCGPGSWRTSTPRSASLARQR